MKPDFDAHEGGICLVRPLPRAAQAVSRPKKGRPLSRRPSFKDAIVASAEWMNMAGGGRSELAFSIEGKSKTKGLWHWTQECGPAESILRTSSWRDACEYLARTEDFSVAVGPSWMVIQGSPRYIGRVLAMAWCDDCETKLAARLLLKLSDEALAALDHGEKGIFGTRLQDALMELIQRMRGNDIDFDSLPAHVGVKKVTPAGIQAALSAAVGELGSCSWYSSAE